MKTALYPWLLAANLFLASTPAWAVTEILASNIKYISMRMGRFSAGITIAEGPLDSNPGIRLNLTNSDGRDLSVGQVEGANQCIKMAMTLKQLGTGKLVAGEAPGADGFACYLHY